MLRGVARFDEHEHVYTVGKWQVPGTGDVLSAAGHLTSRFYTLEGRERGSLFHELIEQIDLDIIQVASVEGPLADRCQGYVRFLELERPTYTLVEAMVVNKRYGIATMIDRAGELRGKMTLNVKSGTPEDWHRLQRALEVMALEPDCKKWESWKRYTLYAGKKRAKLVEHDNSWDFDQALDALNTWRKECHNESKHGPRRWFRQTRVR